MNEQQKQILLRTVKNKLLSIFTDKTFKPIETADPQLLAHRGCFVTLKNKERLRGCIGRFVSDKPLIDLAGEMAESAARYDYRFAHEPITKEELDELEVEISVLSELKKTDNPLSLRLGIDGIYIRRGERSGCFLPQVAEETGWSREEFLSYCCCHKAGLEPDAWKDEKTQVYLFTAEVFGKKFRDIE